MKYLLEKDKKKRKLFEKFEIERICLRALSKDKRISVLERILYKINLSNFVKNSSKTRIKNRCVVSGRGRSIIREFRMSRLQVRDLNLKGLLYGIRRASW